MMEAAEINGKLSSIIRNSSSKGQRSGYLGNLARLRVREDDGKGKKTGRRTERIRGNKALK